MSDLSVLSPLLSSVGLLSLIFLVSEEQSAQRRALASLICIFLSLRYVYWRVLFTIPVNQNLFQQVWSRVFLAAELATVLSSVLVCLFMSRTINRSPIADARQKSPLHKSPVDVFIVTYNEGIAILERTIVGALAIDHSDLRVWVLDDGARSEVRELAALLGAQYVARVKGEHAKAGNINNGLKQALTTGRRPEFILLLDADFIPFRNILNRTLGLFEEADVGIVQTPQHFFNADPVQANLLVSSVWPDEQRFFFSVVMPCKDAWGAAFCCGTSAVVRVTAFEAAGGMATETMCEDMLTSFKLAEHGYRTIYLNERLSMGLAAESLNEFIVQRNRWCLGTIQQVFTRWSFWGRGRINFMNRLGYFDGFLYWLATFAFKVLVLIAPIIYWFTGTGVIRADIPSMVYWMAPMVVCNLMFTLALSRNRVLPIMSDVTQLLSAFSIVRTVAATLVRPFGKRFRVTLKGLSTTRVTVQWRILSRFAVLGGLTLLGLALHISEFNPLRGKTGYELNVFWSMVNLLVFALASIACIELPKRRKDERFPTAENAYVRLEDGTRLECVLKDISLGGAMIRRPEGWRNLVGPAWLGIDGGRIEAPFDAVRREGESAAIHFREDREVHNALIVKLFTGQYHRDVESVHVTEVFRRLAFALFS